MLKTLKSRHFGRSTAALATVAALVCAAWAAGPIKSAVLCADADGTTPKGVSNTLNGKDREFHCILTLDRIYANVQFKSVLYAVDAAGLRNQKIVETEPFRGIVNRVKFNFSLPRAWPPGKYRVDVYVDGKKDRSLPLTMK